MNMSKLENMPFTKDDPSQNKCPLLKTPIYKSIEHERTNMMSLFAVMLTIPKQNDADTNSERFSHFKALLKGKCQKPNSAEITKFWRIIQSSVEKLQVSFR